MTSPSSSFPGDVQTVRRYLRQTKEAADFPRYHGLPHRPAVRSDGSGPTRNAFLPATPKNSRRSGPSARTSTPRPRTFGTPPPCFTTDAALCCPTG